MKDSAHLPNSSVELSALFGASALQPRVESPYAVNAYAASTLSEGFQDFSSSDSMRF
jgi:hypothetical protein